MDGPLKEPLEEPPKWLASVRPKMLKRRKNPFSLLFCGEERKFLHPQRFPISLSCFLSFRHVFSSKHLTSMTFYLILQENLDISNFKGPVPIVHDDWTHQTHDEVSIRIGVVTVATELASRWKNLINPDSAQPNHSHLFQLQPTGEAYQCMRYVALLYDVVLLEMRSHRWEMNS